MEARRGRDTKLAQICLSPRSINFPLPPRKEDPPPHASSIHPFFKVHNLHFPSLDPERAANSRDERAAAFPYSFSCGPRKHCVSAFLVVRPFASPFAFVRCHWLHRRQLPIRNNKITVGESPSGLKRQRSTKREMVPSARLTYLLTHGVIRKCKAKKTGPRLVECESIFSTMDCQVEDFCCPYHT